LNVFFWTKTHKANKFTHIVQQYRVLPVKAVEDSSQQAGRPRSTESPRCEEQRTQQQSMQCKDNVNVEIDWLRCILSTYAHNNATIGIWLKVKVK